MYTYHRAESSPPKAHYNFIQPKTARPFSYNNDTAALIENKYSYQPHPYRPQSLNSLEMEKWQASTHDLLIMITMAVSSLIVAIDATILVPVLPTLALDLHGTTADAFWTGTAYLLSHSVLQPCIARLSDLFGRRELLMPCLAFFAVGSIVCAVSSGFGSLLTGRVIQGVGGAGIITLSQQVFADLVPLRQRPKYVTMVLGAWAAGSLLGPLIGGAIVQTSTWRWCFWLNLPICLIASIMAIFFVTLEPVQPRTLSQKLARIDFTGNFLFISSLTSILIAISWGGIQFAWTSYQTLVPLILGSFGLVVAIFFELRYADYPFLERPLFNKISLIASYVCALLQGLALYMLLYYVTFYFTSTHAFGPVHTGVGMLSATTLLIPGSVVVSALITRFGRFRIAIWAGFVVSTIGAGLFILLTENTRPAVWATIFALFGLGMGMILSAVNFSIQAGVDPIDAGQAAAIYSFMRTLGMTIGVAVGGTVFQNVMERKLQNLGVPGAAEIAKNAESYLPTLRQLDAGQQEVILKGYVAGFRGVWIAMTVLCGIGLISSLFIKRGNLEQVLESKFVRSKK